MKAGTFLAAFVVSTIAQAAIPIHGFKGDMASTSDKFVALDINGDGKTDFLYYRPGSGYAGVYLSNGDGSLRYVEYSRPGKQSNGFVGDVMDPADTFVALDINGDGKSDFLWYRPGSGYAGVYISKGDGTVQFVEYSRPGRQSNGFTSDVMSTNSYVDKAVALDINGDGKSDFLWYRPGGGYAAVYLSKGDGTLQYVEYSRPGTQSNGFAGDVLSSFDTAVALDINGDGKSDFLWYRPGAGYAGTYIANSDGSGKLTYNEYSNPSGQASYFPFDVKSPQDTALALNLQGKKSSDFLWLRPGGGYAGACLSNGGTGLECLSYEGTTATWMADMADQIGKVPLKGIAMPGTHDAGMYYNMSDVDLAKAQEDDFTGQLNAGARWFDFRSGYYTLDIANLVWEEDGSFMTCAVANKPPQAGYYLYGHSNICSNIGVGDALDQIKAFLDTHPKEIVIIDIRAYVGASRTSEYANLLEAHLSPYIYKSNCTQKGTGCDPDLAPQNFTPEYFWRNNQRAILLYSGSGDIGNTDEMWPLSMVASTGGFAGNSGIAGDTDYQLSYMEQLMDPLRPAWSSYDGQANMLELTGALTPGGALGGAGCLSYCFDGPIGMAQWFDPALASKIQGDWQSRALNALAVDYISCCGIAETIINFNDQQWIPILNSAKDIGAGKDGSVWKIDSSGPGPDYGISFFSGSGWYTALNKQAVRIAVDPNGLPWVVDSSGMIWRLKASTLSSIRSGVGGSDAWDSMPGAAQDVGIGADGSVWVLGSTGALFKFNGSTWDQLPGVAAGLRIAVDNFGKPVVIGTDSHGIFRYDGTQWIRYADGDFTTALDIGTGADGSIWVAGTDAHSVGGIWRWNGTGWDRFRGDGANVAVDGSGSPWVVTSGGNIRQGKIR